MKECNRSQAKGALLTGHGGRDLEEALAAHEVGLKARAERIAPPGNPGSMQAGTTQECVVHNGAKGRAGGQLSGNGVTDYREQVLHREPILGEEAVSGAPILKLRTGSSEEARHSMASESKQRTQREGFGACGDAWLSEGGSALLPELLELREDADRVFFRAEGGVSRRRRARRDLSSTIHSTVSPFENSMA